MISKDYEEEKNINGSVNFTKELFKIAEKQKEKSICKIKTRKGHGTGFLCKFPFGSKENLLPVLITNYHIINEKYLDFFEKILFTREIEPSTTYTISLGIPRRIYMDHEYDFTIIENKHEDNLDLNSFLEVDCFDINLKDLEVYTIHFPEENKATLNAGKIESINENKIEIYHKCSTDKGSSGCPIINAKTCKVIGIHKGSQRTKDLNRGVFIKYAVDKFYEMNKKNYYFENFFDGIKIIDIEYKINNRNEKLKILGEKFVENNKNNCSIIINDHEYNLCIYIDINQYKYNNSGTFKIKLKGVNNIKDMSYMFYKCNNLISVPNISQMNTSKLIIMSSLFVGCELLESLPDFSNWNIENCTDIRGMFYNCKNLSKIPDITCWNTMNVTTMKDMFWSCSKLSHKDLPDIKKWNIQKATDAKEVFDGYEYGKNKHLGDYIFNAIVKNVNIAKFIFNNDIK